jgi:hypothetical protein
MAEFTCTTKHMCGMPSQEMDQINQHCVNCTKFMHGALCGALFAKKYPSTKIIWDVLSANGKAFFSPPSTVIFALCIEHLDRVSLKLQIEDTATVAKISKQERNKLDDTVKVTGNTDVTDLFTQLSSHQQNHPQSQKR